MLGVSSPPLAQLALQAGAKEVLDELDEALKTEASRGHAAAGSFAVVLIALYPSCTWPTAPPRAPASGGCWCMPIFGRSVPRPGTPQNPSTLRTQASLIEPSVWRGEESPCLSMKHVAQATGTYTMALSQLGSSPPM